MPKYRIAGACMNQTPLDWKNNVDNILESIELAKSKKVEILCLPELAITGYGCEDLFLSEWLPAKALTFLPKIAEACNNIFVAVGLPIIFEEKLYNCACIIHNKKIKGFSAKQHLALDGVHYEPRWFTAWPQGIVKEITINDQSYEIGDIIYPYENFNIGFEICEDAWRELTRPACRFFDKDVKLIMNPSASHFAMGKSKRREKLVLESSENFDCTYVYANLLGNEAGRMIFDGEIFITQKGKLIQRNNRCSFQNVNMIYADIDPDHVENSIATLNEDEHDKPTEFIKGATLALFDYLRKSRSHGFVLSLSGGADSTTCAILVAEMVKRGINQLGIKEFGAKIHLPEKVVDELTNESDTATVIKNLVGHLLTCAYQATKNSSSDTFNSARELAIEIGAVFYHWNIDDEVASYTGKIEKAIKEKLTWEKHDITLQNIQARSRAPIIWMLANLNNALLLTTSNRSEGDVGYATMDGDTCGSISPIAAVDKHFINQWLIWAENELQYSSLRFVNSLDPTAELRPESFHQTDETDLMPYPILVEIEKLAIKAHKSPTEVYEGLKDKNLTSEEVLKSYITKFFRLWSRNQWKRERIAPSFHLDDFNVDPRTWCRFPILSGGFQDELADLNQK